MPRALKVCSVPRCPNLTAGRHCTSCSRTAERIRGSRQQRGYDHEHDQLRAEWRPRVEAGQVDCHAERCLMRSRRITPGQPWDLGHTDDRTSWTGPEHARCNRAAGGRAAHRQGGTRT